MHILFLSDNFPPEVNAPASRTFEHCREWVAAGHKVTVITCVPNFPKGIVFEGFRNRLWQKHQIAGITVIRVWSYIAKNEGFAKRILDYVSYMFTAFWASLFVRRVDVIVGTSPQFFTACAAYAASVIKRRPWVFELRDIWPESIRAVGAAKDSALLDWLEKLELFLYRRADAVVSVTHAFKQNLVARGINGAKIAVVTNGVDTTRFQPAAKDLALETELGLSGMFVAGYIGTHGMAHGLDTLIDAAIRLAQQDDMAHVRLLCLGDGAERSKLIERSAALGLNNILFVGSVSKDEVVRYWSVLDAAIVHLRDSPLFSTVIPSKIFECMGMGLPVLHGVRGESADIVVGQEIGVFFEPENVDDFLCKLRALVIDNHGRHAMARKGPIAARLFDRRTLAATMLDHLTVVAAGQPLTLTCEQRDDGNIGQG